MTWQYVVSACSFGAFWVLVPLACAYLSKPHHHRR